MTSAISPVCVLTMVGGYEALDNLTRKISTQTRLPRSSGPLSVVEALNWYSYTSNNPVRFIDPTGIMNWEQVGSGLLQMGGGIVKMKGGALLIGSSGGSAVLSGDRQP